MKDGSMFGSLKKKALNKDWYTNEENVITFQTESGISTYKVFSVYQIEKESYYTKTSFKSDEEYKEFLNTLKSRSAYNFGINLGITDKIITLSTCATNGDYRVVVHAVLTGTEASV